LVPSRGPPPTAGAKSQRRVFPIQELWKDRSIACIGFATSRSATRYPRASGDSAATSTRSDSTAALRGPPFTHSDTAAGSAPRCDRRPAAAPQRLAICLTPTALAISHRGEVAFGHPLWSSRLRSSSRRGFSSRNIGFRYILTPPYGLDRRRLKLDKFKCPRSVAWAAIGERAAEHSCCP
jgi:hypothetical protein